MATHKSALKRHRQSVKRNQRNRSVKGELLSLTKRIISASKDEAMELVKTLQGKLARAGQKGTLHHKAASKKISKIMKAAASK